MAAFCLPPNLVNAFNKALQDGKIDVEKMALMSSGERRALLTGFVGADNAKEVNAQFEKKLLLKNWQLGMASWIKSTSGLTEPARRDLVSKVEKMENVLNPADKKMFLADYASKKLGADLTAEEGARIMQLSKKAMEERDKNAASGGSTFGPSKAEVKASEELENYVKSLKPKSMFFAIRDNIAVMMRNMVLMNPSTPIKTTIGQVENSVLEAALRRASSGEAGGAAPEAKEALSKEAWEFFKDTHFSPTTMESYRDSGRLGEHANFDLPGGTLSASPTLNKIEAITRKGAKITNKIAIDYEHVFSFTKVHQIAFFDALHIAATQAAKLEGAKGKDLSIRTEAMMRDAAKIKPETEIGAALRVRAQEQANRVTSINNTVIAEFSIGAKRVLNRIQFKTPGGSKVDINLGLGDIMMPVAKIPANIIWNGIETATPVGPILAVKDIWQGKQKLAALRNEKGEIAPEDRAEAVKALMQNTAGWHRMMRVVGVMGAAALFASMFDEHDFRTDRFGGEYFKLGGVWINTEFISFMSPAFAGFMHARHEVHDSSNVYKAVLMYTAGAFGGLLHTPGLDTASNLVKSMTGKHDPLAGAFEYFSGRLVPAPLHNVFRDRPWNRLFFGAHGVETEEDVARDKAEDRERSAERRRRLAVFNME